MENIAESDLPKPDPQFDELVIGPVQKIGTVSEEIAKKLQKDVGLSFVTSSLPRTLAAHGAEFDAAQSLNVANGTSMILTGVLTKVLVEAANHVKDKDSLIELTPIIEQISKQLIRNNSEQGKIRVALQKAGHRHEELRQQISKVRNLPTSFLPGQVVEIQPTEPVAAAK